MPALAPGTAIDGFVVETVLGQGAMGVVYRAREAATGRTVAIKMILPGAVGGDGVARFHREAKAALAVRHPNVVAALATGRHQGAPYLVSELVPGGSLGAHLAARGRLPWTEAVAIGAAIADGLAAIHAAGLVHRDLKPDNILLGAAGEPRIADLGLARHVAGAGPASTAALTKTGELVGTPSFMSPEQADGQRAVDGRADVYALGCIVFALVTGAPPFEGGVLEVVKKHLLASPPDLRDRAPDAPRALEQLVRRLLEKDPARRPASAAEVAAALRGVGPSARRTPLGVLVLFSTVVVAAAAAGVFVVSGRETPPPAPPPAKAPPAPVAAVLPGSPPLKVPEFFAPVAATASHLAVTAVFGTQDRHSGGAARRLDVDPARNVALVTGDDLALRVFDLATGAQVEVGLPGLGVTAARLVPGRRQAALALAWPGETAVALFDFASGTNVWMVRYGARPLMKAMALSLDANEVYTGEEQGLVRFLSLATGEEKGSLQLTGPADVSCRSMAVTGKWLLVAMSDGALQVIDREARAFYAAHQGHSADVLNNETRAVIESLDVRDGLAVTASHDGTVLVWTDPVNGVKGERLEPPDKHPFYGARLLPGGRVVAIRADATTWLWDPASGKSARSAPRPWGDPCGLAVSADGKRAFVASGGGYHDVDLSRDLPVAVEPTNAEAGQVLRLAVSDDGGMLLSLALDRSASTWDTTSGAQKRLERRPAGGERSAALSSDGRVVLTGGDRDGVVLVHERGKVPRQLRRRSSEPERISALALDGKGSLVVARHGFGAGDARDQPDNKSTLEVWNLNGTSPELRSRSAHGCIDHLALVEGAKSVAILAGHVAASERPADWRLEPRVLELPGGVVRSKARETRAQPTALAVSGHRLVYSGIDLADASSPGSGTFVWDFETGQLDRVGPVADGLALSRDGSLVAIASRADGVVSVRRSARLDEEVAAISLRPLTDVGTACAFAPDGRSLYVGTARGLIVRLALDGAR